MKDKKIVSIGYTDRSFFHHPETKGEFQGLMISFKVAYQHKYMKGMMIIACELFPDKIVCENEEVQKK